jgi:hypothetical protein
LAPGTQIYQKYYASCLDALENGIHPEPGLPVTLLLTGSVYKNCSVENIKNGKTSCHVGWSVFERCRVKLDRQFALWLRGPSGIQGCQIFLGITYQNKKNVPNNRKIYQKATKCTNILNCKTQIGIFCLKICHLATLAVSVFANIRRKN